MPQDKRLEIEEINKLLWKANNEWWNTHSENQEGYLKYIAHAISQEYIRKDSVLPWNKLIGDNNFLFDIRIRDKKEVFSLRKIIEKQIVANHLEFIFKEFAEDFKQALSSKEIVKG